VGRLHGGPPGGGSTSTGKLCGNRQNLFARNENDNGYATPSFQELERKALLIWGADHLTGHDARRWPAALVCGGFNPEGIEKLAGHCHASDLGRGGVPVGRDDRRQARLYGVKLGGSAM